MIFLKLKPGSSFGWPGFYSFEVLRAKLLFSDMLQKKARRVKTVKIKKRPRFDDVPHKAKYLMMGRMTYSEPEYVTRQVVREVNIGADPSTLLAEIDTLPTKG